MSSNGIYGYHPKVEHPNEMFVQMESNTKQPPFFFGGSQVPINLGHFSGKGLHQPTHGIDTGIRTPHRLSRVLQKEMTPSFSVDGSVNGKGLRTTIEKHNNIMLPQHLSSLQR